MTLVIDFQYFANTISYKKLLSSTDIIFDQYENFQKRSFQNRCIIAGANGPITLSVPIEGGRENAGIFREIRISHRDNWQLNHWRSIVSAYNRSPWFEYYRDSLSVLYHEPVSFLKDWNLRCWLWSLDVLKLNPNWKFSDEYLKVYQHDGVLDIRGKISPSHPDPFSQGSENSKHPLVYRQVFEERQGFIPHLSILDLLFCEGGKKAVSMLVTGE